MARRPQQRFTEDDFETLEGRASKTEQKKAVQRMAALGEQLSELSLKQIQKLEEAIALKEEELAIAREKRFDPFYYHDYQNMRELDESIDGIHVDLDKLMKDWESLHEELEKSSKQTNIKV